MRKAIFAVSALAAAAFAGAWQGPGPSPVLKTNLDKASYWLGTRLGLSVQKEKGLVPRIIVRGVTDAFSGTNTLMTDAQGRAAIDVYRAEHRKDAGKQGAPGKTPVPPKPAHAAPNAVLKTELDKVSYAGGMFFGKNLRTQAPDVELQLLVAGFMDEMHGKKLLLTAQEGDKEFTEFLAEIRKKQIAKMEADAAKTDADARAQAKARMAAAPINQKAGDDFLAKNKLNKDVVVLPSGLQYKILKAGTGKKPTDTDTVQCNYVGTLIDGKEFDRSRGTPAEFRVNGVIPGWTEALKLMSVGSKWQLFIPPSLAYGAAGNGTIGPNEVLIFDVELVGIAKR